MSKWTQLLDVYAGVEDDKRWTHLRLPGIHLVPGDGAETAEEARVLVVGEAPGAVENGARRPFTGPSGRALDELLGVAGLERGQCFVTNIVKYRPAGNRTPSFGESIMGRDALRAEFRIIRPLLTIALGAVAHKILHPLGIAGTLALSRMDQGALTPMTKAGYITSIFHPAYGLRYQSAREGIEAAWTYLGEQIEAVPSLRSELL